MCGWVFGCVCVCVCVENVLVGVSVYGECGCVWSVIGCGYVPSVGECGVSGDRMCVRSVGECEFVSSVCVCGGGGKCVDSGFLWSVCGFL